MTIITHILSIFMLSSMFQCNNLSNFFRCFENVLPDDVVADLVMSDHFNLRQVFVLIAIASEDDGKPRGQCLNDEWDRQDTDGTQEQQTY